MKNQSKARYRTFQLRLDERGVTWRGVAFDKDELVRLLEDARARPSRPAPSPAPSPAAAPSSVAEAMKDPEMQRQYTEAMKDPKMREEMERAMKDPEYQKQLEKTMQDPEVPLYGFYG